jgi:hypothetical protein
MTTLASIPQGGNNTTDMLTQEQAAPASPILDHERPTETIDLMVGLLTLNNAGTIESLVQSLLQGLRESFPKTSAWLVNCDAGSQDGTPGIIDRVAAGIVPVRLIPNAASTYANLTRESGFPGRDESIRNFCLDDQRSCGRIDRWRHSHDRARKISLWKSADL